MGSTRYVFSTRLLPGPSQEMAPKRQSSAHFPQAIHWSAWTDAYRTFWVDPGEEWREQIATKIGAVYTMDRLWAMDV